MNFKEFLKSKNISEEEFKKKSAGEMATLYNEYNEAQRKEQNEKIDNAVTKTELESQLKGLTTEEQLTEVKKELEAVLKKQGETIKDIQSNGGLNGGNSIVEQVNKFIADNIDKVKQIHAQKSGVIELTVKAPATVTTGSATNPVAAPQITGVQQAPASNVNLRSADILSLTSNVSTSLAAYPYTETVPKDGNFDFVAEGTAKPQVDLKIETRYATPVKIAAWIKLTDESVQDVVGLQSIATDFLRKKHDLKKQKGILFGDGVSPNPKGATVYGRNFVAGAMANKVANPNIMDVVNACITDVYNTQNYEDEMSYMPSLVVLNPTDFYLQFTAKKDNDGKPLYPTASLFNRVNIGGVTIMPEREIPAGKLFVADMSKYNTTNYVDYTVQIGWVNDDFIKNQFVILGESRFHAFVKRLDEQAFIYDDIATIEAAITKP